MDRFRLTLTLGVLALTAPRARAGGYIDADPNAAALGRAGTAAAIPDGPSAVYYNPAGIALGHGLSIETGVAIDHERDAVTPAGSATLRSTSTTEVPDLFVTQRLGDRFAVGVGFFRAPSQNQEYPDDWINRFHVLRANFGGSELRPVVAGRPFAWLSIGFGLRIVFGDFDLAQAVGDPRYETRLALQGSAIGVGGVIGLWTRLYRDYLTFAWTYQSAIDLDHTGRSTATAPGSATPIAVDELSLNIPLPHQFTFALGSRPRKGTSIQVEARLALLRDFDGFLVTTDSAQPVLITNIPFSLRERVGLRAGFEQRLFTDHLGLRLGIGYDFGAARRDLDPALPDGDRMIASVGLGYLRPDFRVDAGYQASFTVSEKGSTGYLYPADYSTARHTIGLSLSVRIESIGPKPRSFD